MSSESEQSGWFGFTNDSIDSLPPELQERGREAVAEYRAREPIAEVLVRVFRLERGGAEVRIKTQTPDGAVRAEWYGEIGRVAAQEVIDAAETLGDP